MRRSKARFPWNTCRSRKGATLEVLNTSKMSLTWKIVLTGLLISVSSVLSDASSTQDSKNEIFLRTPAHQRQKRLHQVVHVVPGRGCRSCWGR